MTELTDACTSHQQVAVVTEIGGRSAEHDLPVREHVAAVGDLEGEVDVLLDKQDTGARVVGEAPKSPS